MNKEKAAAAKALFMEGYNCSQAVVGAGLKESHPHDIYITKEAPNYSAGI